ncbi:HEAT repeat domain-containing protein [Myxococcota bacterium]|nr:HEAT repeat domain-containing protein [Myxococcota bacterium]
MDVRLDLQSRSVRGTVAHRVAAQGAPLTALTLHAADLDVSAVRAGGEPAPFVHRGHDLRISLPGPLAEGGEVLVEVDYSGAPEAGLYFVAPTDEEPDRAWQAWTQGQDEDSRYWFPCFDDPSMKHTVEVVAEVPEGLMAVSNGELLEVVPCDPGWHRFHYRFDQPLPAYLVALVVGVFDQAEERHGDVRLRWLYPPGEHARARNTFGRTREMVEFFEELTGVPYPYSKYDQAILEDFIFGGMENTTLTTLTATTFHDDRAHLDFRSEPLVSHELAHQWFGDLVTCRSWAHAWLNESWATYLECLYQGRAFGEDELRLYLLGTFEAYLEEDGGRYSRPLVQRRYREPIEVFDRHLYEKGACVLHMLRQEMGDERFWRGVRLYLERHRGGVVETEDFRRAMEEASGLGLERFFAQWIYREGHARLKASSEHDEKAGMLRIRVEQEGIEKPEDARHLTLAVRIFEGEGHRDLAIRLTEARQDVWVPAPAAPSAFVVGSGGWAVAEAKVEQSADAWRTVLARDPDPLGRIAAVAALGKEGDGRSVAALVEALGREAFWGVRARIAAALGAVRGDRARDALLAALTGDESPRVRRAAAKALAGWRGDEKVQAAACDALRIGDASYFVEAELAETVGRIGGERAFDTLEDALSRDSHAEVIRRGVLAGLAHLRDPRGLAPALEWSRRGRDTLARVGAATALGRLGPFLRDRADREAARERLEALLADPFWHVRRAAIAALKEAGDPAAIPALERKRGERDGRLKQMAEEAIAAIRDGQRQPEALESLRRDLDGLREENRKLRERLDKVESKG